MTNTTIAAAVRDFAANPSYAPKGLDSVVWHGNGAGIPIDDNGSMLWLRADARDERIVHLDIAHPILGKEGETTLAVIDAPTLAEDMRMFYTEVSCIG